MKHCVDRIAKRLLYGKVKAVLLAVVYEAVCFGDLDVIGKTAVGIDADDLGVLADMPLAALTEFAFAANDMGFSADDVTHFHSGDMAAGFDNFATEFMPGG